MEEMSETPQSSSAETCCSITVFVWSWILVVLKFIHVSIFHENVDIISVRVNLFNCWENFIPVTIKDVWTLNCLIFSFILSQVGIKKSCNICTIWLLGNVFNNLINWNWNIKNLISSEFDLNSTFMSIMKCCININNLLWGRLQHSSLSFRWRIESSIHEGKCLIYAVTNHVVVGVNKFSWWVKSSIWGLWDCSLKMSWRWTEVEV